MAISWHVSWHVAVALGLVLCGCVDDRQARPDPDEPDGEAADAEPITAPDADPPEPLRSWIRILGLFDSEFFESDDQKGPDVCSVTFSCPDGRRGHGVEASMEPGSYWGAEERWTVGTDPALALGGSKEVCDEPHNRDDALTAVSLGDQGALYVRLATVADDDRTTSPVDLGGCTVVVQMQNKIADPMSVSLCTQPAEKACTLVRAAPDGEAAPDGFIVVMPP